MAVKTSEWTFKFTDGCGIVTMRTDVSVYWDSMWAHVTYNGGKVYHGRIQIVRDGTFGVRHDRFGYPVIGAAPIREVTVEGDGFRGTGKTIKDAVEAWASNGIMAR